ncbi:ABC transporter ATP-binding protein [Billgrantia endophytica]|uniref:ABC transporter ATP-binding protein n=1 Tax=Billgrantia endophytica TaxID=2033802 RepID=A0A2N7U1K6_9GAMM|nr:ABC transporter ATP-binding protein [Halomonas endophytica]PMR74325.1 ABC transporter ATP-binding protein [Halomonas endophytica]
MSSSIAITLKQCGRTFASGHTALEPIDLRVEAGETLVLLGPSGCGKTTTLRLIGGLETPDPGGRVWFGERDVTALPIEKRDVGMVFQNYALFPNMNVTDNIAYGLRIRRLSAGEVRRRVDEVMEMVGLHDFARRGVDELSGGQKQRVALARAIAVRPKVLLFDEPLSALDAKLRDRLRLEIGTLLRRLGTTAVYVTHDQAEAMALGDRVAVMERGRIAQIGSPREIYHQPHSAFVADFIGSVNRIAIGGTRDGWLEVDGGRLFCPRLHGADHAYCRPEDIEVGDPASAPISGRVVQSFFLGQSQRLLVDTGGDAPLQVEAPARRQWRRGEAIGLSVASDALFHPHHPLTFGQAAAHG